MASMDHYHNRGRKVRGYYHEGKRKPVCLYDGEAVREIFHKLNEKGKTIIIVTHDAKVAEHCERIIHLRDSMVLDEGLGNDVQDERVVV